ncbi:MAG TPA: PAS domain S-box protein [Acetivibrio sp.]|nr:PAS domain S-box protein [Acetivibrio sp.]
MSDDLNEDLEVLVAGNDEKLTTAIENVFFDMGYKCFLRSVGTLDELKYSFLVNNTFDIVFFDCSSDILFSDVIELIKKLNDKVPIIALLEEDSGEQGLEMMKSGASDYCIRKDTARLKSIVFGKCRELEHKRDKKKFEIGLMEENERLVTTLESIGDGVIVTDEKGQVVMMNKAAQELTGYSSCYSIGKPLSEVFVIINGITQEPETSPYERVLIERKTVGLRKNTMLVSKDGSLRYVSASTAPIKNSDGTIMGVVVVFRDITRIRKAEEKLHKLSQAVEQSPSIIVIADIHGNIEYVNPRFTEVTGYSINEVIGESLFFMEIREDSIEKYDEMIESIFSGKEWRGEIRHKSKNDVIFWEYACYSPIINSEGVITNYLKVSEDITERKLMSENLFKAKEAAEAANRAKSEFLANMSHEIRTPLNGIIGMTNLTLQTELTEEQKENLNIINSCADLLLRVINDILDYSKIEAGKMTLENVKFDFLNLLDKTYKSHIVQANDKGLRFSYTVKKGIPRILVGDPGRFQQVLNNLISNAIKFTDVGEVKIDADIAERRDDSIKLKLTVSDTGIGIDDDKIGRLFKSFSQGDSSITRKYGGTGLGLAISKQLVEMMGGEIWVKSQKGKGSTFCFTVSFRLKDKGSANTEYSSDVCDGIPERKLNILLAEDDKVNQRVIAGMLKKGQYSLTIAENGFEAIKLFEENEFDLILMDIQMPQMDGIEATKRIRKMEEGTFRHIPIIAVTAHAFQNEREKFLEAGMDDFIPKPFSFDNVYAVINRVLYRDEQSGDNIEERKEDENTYFKLSKEVNESSDKNEVMQNLSFEDMMERLKLSILNKNMAAVDKSALAVKELAQDKGYDKVKSLAFKIQLLARKNQPEDVQKLYEELKQEVDKLY